MFRFEDGAEDEDDEEEVEQEVVVLAGEDGAGRESRISDWSVRQDKDARGRGSMV